MRHPLLRRLKVLLGLGLILLAARPGWGAALPDNTILQRTRESSAWILNQQGKESFITGTGWVFDAANRLLVTNDHVVGDSVKVAVMFPLYRDRQLLSDKKDYLKFLAKGEHIFRGTVLATDAKRDLALIQLDHVPQVAALPLAKESSSKNERVFIIGNPGDSKQLWATNSGSVEHVASEVIIEANTGLQVKANILRVQMVQPIKPGYSGGPVVNERGEIVGVTTVKAAGLGGGCIDVSEIRTFVEEARRVVNPKTSADYKNAGSYHSNQKRYDRALEFFTKAIQLLPTDPEAYVFRGSVHIKQGNYDLAIKEYDRAIQINSKYAWAYNNRGDAYRLKRQYDRALRDFNNALQCNADYAFSYYNRSLVYRAHNDLEQAKKDYQKALTLAPTLADYQPEVPRDELKYLDRYVRKYLPDDVQAVLAVNVRELLDAPAAKLYRAKVEELLKNESLLQVTLTGLAIDPFQDLSRIFVAGSSPDGKLFGRWRLLIQGRFDPDRFHTLANDYFGTQKVADSFGGQYRIYEIKKDSGLLPGYFALVNSTLLVYSPNQEEVVDALTKGAGWKRTALEHDEVQECLRRVNIKQPLWLLALGGALVNKGVAADKAFGLQSLTGGFTLDRDARAEFVVSAVDEKSAPDLEKEIAKDLPKLVESLNGQATKNKELAPLVELLRALRLTRRGDSIIIKGRVPGATLEPAVRKTP